MGVMLVGYIVLSSVMTLQKATCQKLTSVAKHEEVKLFLKNIVQQN